MILITGYGSIGSLVAKKLETSNLASKIIIDKNEEKIHKARIELDRSKTIALVADVINRFDLEKVFSYPIDAVIHTAAMKHVTFCESNPYLAVINNITGMNNLLEMFRTRSCIDNATFINISTDKSAFPANVMGATKFIAERCLISASHLPQSHQYKNIRLGNVLCSTGSLIPTIQKTVANNAELTITDLKATRFFISPDQVSDFIIQVLIKDYRGQILIRKLKSATLKTMLEATFELIGAPNYPYKIVGLRQGEKLHEHLYTDAECGHIQDCGDYWSINYDEDHPPLPVVDSSMNCVSKNEFKNILKGVLS